MRAPEAQDSMDMRTLLLERACLLTFCTLLVLVNVREHRTTPGVRWFAASNVNYFIGGLLIANRSQFSVWISVVLANLLYSLGYVFLHHSLTDFLESRRRYWWAQLAVAALALALVLSFTVIHPDIRYRLAAVGLTTGLQFAICTAVALEGAKTPLRSAALGMAGVLGFSAVLNLTRVGLTLIWGTTQVYLHADHIQTVTVMLNTMIFVTIDIAFVWMIAATLRNELHVQAMTDPLTHALNRRALEMLAERAFQRSRVTGHPLSVIVVDLDGFKQINDRLGHRIGDLTLVAAAQALKAELRASDSLARIGGDEFVVLLPDCPRNSAQEIAERLRATLEAQEIQAGDHRVEIRASFGVATLEEFAGSCEWLMAEGDRALYRAKSVGGNYVNVM